MCGKRQGKDFFTAKRLLATSALLSLLPVPSVEKRTPEARQLPASQRAQSPYVGTAQPLGLRYPDAGI